MKNELILVNNIEKTLQEKREPSIFPLASNHRKELRKLRDDNVGNLRLRLSTIKTLKKEEYEKKYSKEIEKELERYAGISEKLNTDWINRLKKINDILKERKQLEEKSDVNKLSVEKDYNQVSDLNKVECKRKFSLNRKQKSLEIAREEFEKKFGENFSEVDKKINIIVTHYEEAINFGDLEIVKKLYYMMKKSDDFFTKISDLKI